MTDETVNQETQSLFKNIPQLRLIPAKLTVFGCRESAGRILFGQNQKYHIIAAGL
jgi:hypothetical protein